MLAPTSLHCSGRTGRCTSFAVPSCNCRDALPFMQHRLRFSARPTWVRADGALGYAGGRVRWLPTEGDHSPAATNSKEQQWASEVACPCAVQPTGQCGVARTHMPQRAGRCFNAGSRVTLGGLRESFFDRGLHGREKHCSHCRRHVAGDDGGPRRTASKRRWQHFDVA